MSENKDAMPGAAAAFSTARGEPAHTLKTAEGNTRANWVSGDAIEPL